MRYLVIFAILSFISCDSSKVYEDYEDLSEAFWHVDSVKTFSFPIEDTSSRYNMYATFRNASSYPFYNLYYQFVLTDSLDITILQELKEAHLFDPKTGEPYGRGLGDLFDHYFPLKENHSFAETGNYQIKLKQFMRRDTLPYILSVGVRVEVIEEEK